LDKICHSFNRKNVAAADEKNAVNGAVEFMDNWSIHHGFAFYTLLVEKEKTPCSKLKKSKTIAPNDVHVTTTESVYPCHQSVGIKSSWCPPVCLFHALAQKRCVLELWSRADGIIFYRGGFSLFLLTSNL